MADQFQMTESFASAVASVAPVILLVGAVELVTLERRLREVWMPSVETKALAILGLLTAGFLWCGFMVLLCVAEAKALRWLATPEAPVDAADAKFCVIALSLGFVWVALVPTARVVNLIIVPVFTRVPPRFAREAAREAETEGEAAREGTS
ncbi:hypothetical protein AB0F96_40865 [Streptomyces sp. NPDC023998]|uniref:hypothetical protein n=1 Tax=Streptomyces sp. NPDC023998 TaxID=3154597 RepID=UPI0033F297CF